MGSFDVDSFMISVLTPFFINHADFAQILSSRVWSLFHHCCDILDMCADVLPHMQLIGMTTLTLMNWIEALTATPIETFSCELNMPLFNMFDIDCFHFLLSVLWRLSFRHVAGYNCIVSICFQSYLCTCQCPLSIKVIHIVDLRHNTLIFNVTNEKIAEAHAC